MVTIFHYFLSGKEFNSGLTDSRAYTFNHCATLLYSSASDTMNFNLKVQLEKWMCFQLFQQFRLLL